ncbi:MAG: hypothetical protein FWG82_07065 [Oscillospiraceae bacterium]|nr:hypothetical protein [Oscillospiraceae bacterium]
MERFGRKPQIHGDIHGNVDALPNTPDPEYIVVGVAENDNSECRMVWAKCEDFESQASEGLS